MSDHPPTLTVPAIDLEFLLERFLRYVAVDTRAIPDSATYPSNPTERLLGERLVAELKELGLADAMLDAHGVVMATLPGNHPAPMIGWIAHLDTAAETPAAGIKPRVLRNYQGEAVHYPANPSLVLSPENSPSLASAVGHDLVVTDGTTLLGADDKAGIAAIMAALEALRRHPEWPRGDLRIGFTPDEEIGQGTRYFDAPRFGTRIAYTVDGETAPELNEENFNAASASLRITGLNVHPGKAKDLMVNAITVLADFLYRLPGDLTPQATSGREGFIHPHRIEGAVEGASVELILRDFDLEGLAAKEQLLKEIVAEVQARHPGARLALEVRQAYRNMGTYLQSDPRVTDLAIAAMREAGLEPLRAPLRGGTDGANLSRQGILTPNLFTGSGNHHGLTEWASLQQMGQAAEVLVRLARLWSEPPARP